MSKIQMNFDELQILASELMKAVHKSEDALSDLRFSFNFCN
jgi:uncharacterized protein YukE